jgi:phosphoribosylanthranilate isomerase
MVTVKICGITNWTDARLAVEAGAKILGFNFCPESSRYIDPGKARRIVRRLPKKIRAVGVFVNQTEEVMLDIARKVGLHFLQLHGDESPDTVARLRRSLPVIKAVQVRSSFRPAQLAPYRGADALLLDGFDGNRRGGTGKTFEWRIAKRTKRYGRIFLAGGLKPENAAEAIRIAKPYAIDVCSGVESKPGKKDGARIEALMRAVRAAQRKRS